MPWPIPAPADLAATAASAYQSSVTPPDGSVVDATSPNTVLGATGRVLAMLLYEVYLHQLYIQQELWPDTTQDNLDRLASIWGLTRLSAAAASGPVTLTGAPDTPLPAGIVFAGPLGQSYTNAAPSALNAQGTATLTITAETPGDAGNLAAGQQLQITNAVAGVSPQTAVVAPPGLAGGSAPESNSALRARVLARIRARGNGGSIADFERWAFESSTDVAYAVCVPNYNGVGLPAVFVAGAGPSALTSAEVAPVQSLVAGKQPVGSQVTVLSATLQTIDATISLNPDTTATRAAATAAFAAWVVGDAAIGGAGGGTMYVSRMDAALAAADGEFSHERIAPTADVPIPVGAIAVPGTLSFA